MPALLSMLPLLMPGRPCRRSGPAGGRPRHPRLRGSRLWAGGQAAQLRGGAHAGLGAVDQGALVWLAGWPAGGRQLGCARARRSGRRRLGRLWARQPARPARVQSEDRPGAELGLQPAPTPASPPSTPLCPAAPLPLPLGRTATSRRRWGRACGSCRCGASPPTPPPSTSGWSQVGAARCRVFVLTLKREWLVHRFCRWGPKCHLPRPGRAACLAASTRGWPRTLVSPQWTNRSCPARPSLCNAAGRWQRQPLAAPVPTG